MSSHIKWIQCLNRWIHRIFEFIYVWIHCFFVYMNSFIIWIHLYKINEFIYLLYVWIHLFYEFICTKLMNSFNCGEGKAQTVSAYRSANRERVARTARAQLEHSSPCPNQALPGCPDRYDRVHPAAPTRSRPAVLTFRVHPAAPIVRVHPAALIS